MRVSPWLPALLGFIAAVGPLSTDMYLPSFPAIEASLGAPAGSAEITLATWFAGLAVGQITQGTLSDRYGRRGPLLVAMSLYTLSAAACALAPSLVTLSFFRFVSAFGGSAGMVVPRAIVRDLAEGHAAARLMSQLMLVMGVAPILAPTVGGLILEVGSWRTIFWVGAAYGATAVALIWFLLPDTLPVQQRVRLGLGGLITRYVSILRERGFITHALMGGSASFAMFAFLGGSPDVFIDIFHLSPPAYGALFGCCAFGFISGSQISPRLLARFGASRMMRAAVRVMLAAATMLTAAALARTGQWLLIALPIFLVMSSNGFVVPNTTVGALARHAAHAGSASAVMGTLQFVLGAISGTLVGVLTDGTARPMALLMLLGAAGAVAADLCRPKRQ